jgi:tRNA-splicing ligase RtcB
MKQVISTEKVPIKMWLDDIEDGAVSQAKNLANLPFVHKHIAIMPDSHQGFGMPIGGVMATKGVVIPNAVGVDIGCGMCAIKTPFYELGKMKDIMSEVRNRIPLGFKKHKYPKSTKLMPNGVRNGKVGYPIVDSEFNNALKSLGTLGGGNHFIEFQKGSDGYVWIMVHSGSRNLGYKVAEHYNNLAIELNKKWHSNVPKEWGLAFLPIDSNEGQDYLREMSYCVEFAFCNRRLMMNTIIEVLIELGNFQDEGAGKRLLDMVDSFINISHNYAQIENHFGDNVMVHRKGATLAREDTIGIIPGSQGTNSYIVKGKGNKDSFNSCSHGAGRVMGRKQAQKTLNLEDEIKHLDDMGVIHSIRTEKDLDEASGSYKDIHTVMSNQSDLVDILVELKPLAVIKG